MTFGGGGAAGGGAREHADSAMIVRHESLHTNRRFEIATSLRPDIGTIKWALVRLCNLEAKSLPFAADLDTDEAMSTSPNALY